MRTGLGVVLLGTLWLVACSASEGELCNESPDCSSGLTCHKGECRDPNTFCRTDDNHKAQCERDGLCQLMADVCAAGSEEDCKSSKRCKEHGHCAFAGGCCSRDGVCRSDEEDPLTHIYRLAQPEQRAKAIDALDRLFNSSLVQDSGDRGGPHVAPVIADIAKPLSEAYLKGDLEPASRAKALHLLAKCRHADTAPALVAAVKDFKGNEQTPGGYEVALGATLVALADLRVEAAGDHVFRLFTSLRASSRTAQIKGLSHAVRKAVMALVNPAWEDRLIHMIGQPVAPHGDIKRWRDEVFWQVAAARALGKLGSQKAVEPLMKIVLSPQREDIAPAAIEALVMLGKPSAELAAAVISGEAEELVSYGAEQHREARAQSLAAVTGRSADALRLTGAAIVLANVGRADATETVLDALAKTDPVGKGRIALHLAKLPHSDELVEAFRATYEQSPLDLSISAQHHGVAALIWVVPDFLDPTLTPWIVERAMALTGNDTENAPFREPALAVAMRQMTDDQTAKVHELGQLVTPEKWQSDHRLAVQLLGTCEKKLQCYLDQLRAKGSAGTKDSFKLLKAVTMAGLLAKPEDKPALLKALTIAPTPALRRALGVTLDRLSPKGDAALAKQLDQTLRKLGLIDDPILSAVVGRLRARVDG
ncbi:MAG: hypothetical protein JRI68_10255 [Deltaproteobacteria bacterium]|nr:hypothetical protein [Deltaproteobacteria bacterium]